MRLPGLGPKTAARIWQELGVTTIEELKRAAEQEQLRTLAGLGAKTEERILKALAEKKQEPSDRRLLGDGLGALLAVVSVLREHPAAVNVSEAGSARRRKETFRDLDIIATATDPEALIDYFTKLKWVIEVVAKGPTKATVLSNEGLRFDLRVVPPESYGNLLQHFTGSKDHNLALRERAVKQGLSVSEYSITVVETGEELKFEDEAEVYERLGYQFIPPELRENAGELEAARNGELAEARRARRRQGRPPLPHDLVGRPRHARADGARRTCARLQLPRDHRPPARHAGGAERRHRQAQRAAEAVPHPQGDRSQHPHRRLAVATRRRARRA